MTTKYHKGSGEIKDIALDEQNLASKGNKKNYREQNKITV
jgi:hypothetical protein